MPRTKVTKSSKRNRDGLILEDKMRSYDLKMEAYAMDIEELALKYIAQVDTALTLTMSVAGTKLLQMKMGEFFQLQLINMSDYKATVPTVDKNVIRTDEGYLTEEGSTACGTFNSLPAPGLPKTPGPNGSSSSMRPLGPLHSARARRDLRSRSACEEPTVPGSAKPKPILPGAVGQSQSDHSSRNKLRTPIPSRTKAFSTERTPPKTVNGNHATSPSTPALEFLRWPKPGEVVLSKRGTPILTQAQSVSTANVNIPMKDGVLSLRPRKLDQKLQPNFIEKIDTETLQQIKTLQQNLNIILSMAEKTSIK